MQNKFRPRFSLRTLLLATLTLGAAAALWRNYDPWRIEKEFLGATGRCQNLRFSPDQKWISTQFINIPKLSGKPSGFRQLIWNVESGVCTELDGENWAASESKHVQLDSEFSEKSHWLLTSSVDDNGLKLKCWNLQTLSERVLTSPEPSQIYQLRCGRNSDVAFLLKNDDAQFVDMNTGVTRARFNNVCGFRYFEGLIALLKRNGEIELIDSVSYRPMKRILKPVDWHPHLLTLLSDRYILASVTRSESAPETEVWREDVFEDTLLLDLQNPERFEILPGYLKQISSDLMLAVFVVGEEFRVVDLRTQRIFWSGPYEEFMYLYFLDDTKRFFRSDSHSISVHETLSGRTIYQIDNFNWESISPDHRIILGETDKQIGVHFQENGELIQVVPQARGPLNTFGRFSRDSQYFLTQDADTFSIHLWTRHRPERWWGLAWLPEFWLLIALTAAFIWSIHRDRKPAHAK